MANGLPVERLYGFSKIPRRPRHPRFCRDSSETTAQTGGLKALARRALARDTNRDRESRYPLEIKTPSETVSFADSDSERSPTGWSDGLGLLNSWGNRPETTIPSHHSTNTRLPLSMPVSLLTRLAMTQEVPRQRAITYEPPRTEAPPRRRVSESALLASCRQTSLMKCGGERHLRSIRLCPNSRNWSCRGLALPFVHVRS